MKKEKENFRFWTLTLFFIYLLLLVWIILFKLQFSIKDLATIRSLNLVPFYYSNSIGAGFHIKEIILNVFIFLPYGVFLSMIDNKIKFGKKIVIIAVTSISLEILQYILSVGSTDITDVLTNTVGGILGIFLYNIISKFFKTKRKTDLFVLSVASIILMLFILMIIVLIGAN